ncbi:MAG TPA: DUF4437 domain-containing protein [Thermoanaerobaculia bacterium]
MRTEPASIFLVSFVAAASLAQADKKSESTPKSDASRLVVMPAAEVHWTDLDPKGAPGVRIADIWGDQSKGAFGAFLKFPAGFAAPLHTHSYDYKYRRHVGHVHSGTRGQARVSRWPGLVLVPARR